MKAKRRPIGICFEDVRRGDVVGRQLTELGRIANISRDGVRINLHYKDTGSTYTITGYPTDAIWLHRRPSPKEITKGGLLYAVFELACRVAKLEGRLVPDLKPKLLIELRDAIDACLLDRSRPRVRRKSKQSEVAEERPQNESLMDRHMMP